MLTYKIHLIRHGLTQANLDGCYIGSRTDLPLCPQGRQQLEELRESWEYPFVDRVYTSPLLRAKETAEILFPDRLLETVDNLRELDFGEFEGRSAAELEKDPAFQKWISSPASACPPKGESGEQLQKRAVQAVAYIFGQMMEKKNPFGGGGYPWRADYPAAGCHGTASAGGDSLEYRSWTWVYPSAFRPDVDERPQI